jgi:hypothetical protein
MASHTSATPETQSFTGNLGGVFSIFIDPEGAARQVFYRWCWVLPMVLLSVAIIVQSLMTLPSVEHVLLTNPPAGVTPEAIPRILGIQKIFSYVGPVFAAVFMLLGALLIFGTASILQVKATFGNLFNLVAMGSLIKVLDVITSVIIVRAKGDDITSMAALHPSVGLDLLVTDSTNKVLAALMNFFSIPTIWAIVMTALTFSFAFKVSKTKGFIAMAPYWLMFLALAVVGGLFTT